MLVARHPEVLAGAAAMDSVTDLARRYGQMPQSLRPHASSATESLAAYNLQCVMRREVGGTPAKLPPPTAAAPSARPARSPRSASRSRSGGVRRTGSCPTRRISPRRSSVSCAASIRPRRSAPTAAAGRTRRRCAHSALLSFALEDFGLLPDGARLPASVRHMAAPSVTL